MIFYLPHYLACTFKCTFNIKCFILGTRQCFHLGPAIPKVSPAYANLLGVWEPPAGTSKFGPEMPSSLVRLCEPYICATQAASAVGGGVAMRGQDDGDSAVYHGVGPIIHAVHHHLSLALGDSNPGNTTGLKSLCIQFHEEKVADANF